MPSLAELLDAEERVWMPHKNEDDPRKILGLVVRTYRTMSDYRDGTVPGIVVYDPEAKLCWRVTGFHSVLEKELNEQRPRVGDVAGLRYDGKKAGGKSEYESYRVVLQHSAQPAPEPDWDAIEARRDADAERGIGDDPEHS
jgi:hypothetical protein